jgi:Holliday junction resolvasome RuvABC endonuclease subunit
MSDPINFGNDAAIYFDLSSTCTGFCISKLDSATKTVEILKAGVLWFGNDWDHGQKYSYVADFLLNQVYVGYAVNTVVAEGYIVNLAKASGTMVIPELTGAIKAACHTTHPPIDFYTILPNVWRYALGIKKDNTKAGTSAWKIPAKEKVEQILSTTMPEKLVSNITGKPKKTPYDLTDALGVCLGWWTKVDATMKFTVRDKCFE